MYNFKMQFQKYNIEYTIIACEKIQSHFVVKFQVANFLQNTYIYFLLPEWSKVGLNIEKMPNSESNNKVTCNGRITSLQQTTACMVHFNNTKSLFNTNFGSAVLLERTRRFLTTPLWGNVQEISGNLVGPRGRVSSRLWSLFQSAVGP